MLRRACGIESFQVDDICSEVPSPCGIRRLAAERGTDIRTTILAITVITTVIQIITIVFFIIVILIRTQFAGPRGRLGKQPGIMLWAPQLW